jgi:hypothetical protein
LLNSLAFAKKLDVLGYQCISIDRVRNSKQSASRHL